MEVDRRDEVLHAAVAPRHVLYPQDLRVDRLAPRVRHLKPHIRQDVIDPALEHLCNLDHRFEPGADCPTVPSVEERAGSKPPWPALSNKLLYGLK